MLKQRRREKVVERQKDFIANASHELRTPITIIRGFAETLQDFPDLPEEMRKMIIEKIVRTCGRLEKLVKSLLTLSDAEHISEESFHSCDLFALAERCKELLLAAHPEARVSICGEPIAIIADPDLLELAVMNLLENAVRYSVGRAEIEISLRYDERETCLAITDKGIGIPEADLSRIFDRFYTVDKTHSRQKGGAGLGLSIVKTIIERHGGEHRVSSKLGEGSIFSLVFPKEI